MKPVHVGLGITGEQWNTFVLYSTRCCHRAPEPLLPRSPLSRSEQSQRSRQESTATALVSVSTKLQGREALRLRIDIDRGGRTVPPEKCVRDAHTDKELRDSILQPDGFGRIATPNLSNWADSWPLQPTPRPFAGLSSDTRHREPGASIRDAAQ
jgi:hypothetical protein